MSDSVWPHRWQPTRLPHPWDSSGKNTGVGCHFLLQCMTLKSESEVTQSCPTLSDPTDRGPPGSSVHGIFQARILEWLENPLFLWLWMSICGVFLVSSFGGFGVVCFSNIMPLSSGLQRFCFKNWQFYGSCLVCNEFFSLAAFKVLSLSLHFDTLIIMCLVWISLGFSYLELSCLPESWCLYSSPS